MLVYTLPHIIENAAQKKPNEEAFKYLEETITFSELNLKSNQLAQHLITLDVKKGDRIGVYMHRCLETTIAIYGILKSGGVYVPLDPFSPISRTQYVIEDCDIKHIVTTPKQLRKITKISEEGSLQSVIGIEQELSIKNSPWKTVFDTSLEQYRPVNILGDDLAYILYTSGSTGVPKGIMHTHTSSLAFVKLVSEMYAMEGEVYGMHAPLHFDPSVQGYFAAPYALAKTIIVSDAHTKMPSSLIQLIEKEKITIWFSVPLVLIQMLLHGGLEKRDMSSLKWVLFSGEVFVTKHLQTLMELWPFAKFSNIYGPTETNQCTYYHLETPPENDDPIPIGHVWGDTEYKIIDTQDDEVLSGQSGELVVRTSTMMKGYWNNPELTQKSLYKEEVIPSVQKLYYRTGDQVRQDEKGTLFFLGRNDRQIKIRGYRIEIDEVESVLTKHPEIEESAVIVTHNTATDQKELSSVVLASKNANIDEATLKKFCKQHLSIYAIPDSIQILEELPRTASGKINRKEIETILIS